MGSFIKTEEKIELSKWILIAQKYNCGELLITSIDKDGTKKGFDLELLNFISEIKIKTPIIFWWVWFN